MDIEKFRDRDLRFWRMDSGICNRCKHVAENGATCAAFPDAIPAVILLGRHDHHIPFEGDHGIQFEERE